MPNTPMCYASNYLSKVIIRADFSSNPLGMLSERTTFSESIAEAFPHINSRPVMEMSINMSAEGNGGVERQNTGTHWIHYKAVDGTAYVTLAPNFLTLEYGPGDYKTFDDFFAEFKLVFNALIEKFNIPQVDRIGLRYINEIRLPGKALDWDGVIAPELVSSVKAALQSNARMLRSMHQMVQQFEDDQVLFTYGIVNPDFPAPVVQRDFILDIDCCRQGITESGKALSCVRRLNELATEIFELSIGDGLRHKLGVVE